MSNRFQITGSIPAPELRFTPSQKAVLELRVNATVSERDKQTNQWGDVGEPLWVSAAFWEDEAVRLSETLGKGDRVTVEGVLVLESFTRRDGGQGARHVLKYSRFLGVVPRRQGHADPMAGQPSYQAPADNPWGAPDSQSFDENPPF